MNLREILNKVREGSLRKDELRQEVQTLSRKTTRMSKQAIFSIHRDKIDDAESLLKEAGLNLDKLNDLSKICPEVDYTSIMEPALEEYAEAQILLRLIKDGVFIGPEDIGVPGESYVLGLADVIGELRRRALDLIRRGNTGLAEECLDLMETIYNEIIGCDELLILVPGLRRKCDVARRVIEATRGDVTTEVRRTMLNNIMRDLQKSLESLANK